MRISERKIEEIRVSANIVDIISQYVPLRKRGKNYKGLCPFHNEKTPSFTVSEEKQIYHCFGCHAGGNVYSFLMEYNKISFVEAVQQLAEQLGIQIDYESPEAEEQQSEAEILYEINTEAARYFSDNLLNKKEGEFVKEYLSKRSIKSQTIRTFGLGYALDEWENFISFAKEKNMDIDKSIQLGLIGKNSDGRLYDKFSGRLIFPIFSPNGRVIAFAGRILKDKERTVKYLNSPESLIYHKGRTLYGLSLSKDEIRRLDKVILVEGYMDLISLYQCGVKYVVAVSGTALTEEQVQLLSRYTKNVVLLFDADTAGIKASMRSIEILLKKDMEINIATLPENEDPDSFINNYGKEKFDELVSQAQNFLEYQLGYYESLGMFKDPAKTAEAIRELVKPIALIKDELKRNLLIKVANKFNLRTSLLERELDKITNNINKQITSEERIRDRKQIEEESAIVKTNLENISSYVYNRECELIKLLYEGKEDIVELIFNYIKPSEFLIEAHSKLAEIVHEAFNNKESINEGALMNKINDKELQIYLRKLTFEKYEISKSWETLYPGLSHEKILSKIALDTVLKYQEEQIDIKIAANNKKMEESMSEDKRFKIVKENQQLNLEKKQIRKDGNKDLV